MPPVLAVGRRLDVERDGLGKALPLVVHLGRRVLKGDVFPRIATAYFDVFLAVLTKAQRAVGANHLAFKIRRSVGVAYGHGRAGEAVLVADKGRRRIVAGLVVRAGANGSRDRRGLRSHHPRESIDDVDAVGQPHAAAVEATAVLGPPPGEIPVFRHVADSRDHGAELAGVEDFLGLETSAVKVLRQPDH